MVIVNLSPGDHDIEMNLAGYAPYKATIRVSSTGGLTCVSVVNGNCNSPRAPGMLVSGTFVTGYIKESEEVPVSSYDDWVNNKGGAGGLKGNLASIGEIIDAFLKIKDIGFTVTIGHIGSTIDYYLGLTI